MNIDSSTSFHNSIDVENRTANTKAKVNGDDVGIGSNSRQPSTTINISAEAMFSLLAESNESKLHVFDVMGKVQRMAQIISS